MMEPIYENIPQEIKLYPQWVNWKSVERDGKATKPPFQPDGKFAESNNPATWNAFITVKASADRFDGIGFVLTEDDPFVGVDFDKCYCPAFKLIDPVIEQHLKSLNTYVEISPSGRGLRALLRGRLPVDGRKNGRVEIYQTRRYVTLTGHILPGYPVSIEPRQAELETFYQKAFPEKNVCTNLQKQICTIVRKEEISESQLRPLTGDWRGRLQIAFKSKHGVDIKRLYDEGDTAKYGYDDSAADMALCAHLAFWFTGDSVAIDEAFRESKLFREKWDHKHFSDGRTYGQATIEEAIRGCKEFYQESIKSTPLETPTYTQERIEPEIKADSLPFPDGVMTGLAGDFAKIYSRHLEAPEHFFFLSFLTCLGSILSNRLTLNSELSPQSRLFVLLLGESADDRKSTAISKTVEFFHEAITDFKTSWGVGSAEGLQKKLEESNYLLLCFDEFKQFVGKCKIETSVLLPCVCTLFESNRYEARTKTVDICLKNAHLAMLAASTLQTYQYTWDSSFTDIGFNNRLFIVPGSAERRFSIPSKIPEAEKVYLRKSLGNILGDIGTGLTLDITDEARDLYHSWYLNTERSIHAKRLDTYALRFMSLLAVNENKSEINQEIIKKVIALVNWELEARKLYDPIDADSTIARFEETIRRHLRLSVKSERELKRLTHAHRSGLWIYERAKQNLIQSKEIFWDKGMKQWKLV